jgi:hypothetical protein
MNNLRNLLTEITQLTSHIKTNCPELYRLLHENKLTISASNNQPIN